MEESCFSDLLELVLVRKEICGLPSDCVIFACLAKSTFEWRHSTVLPRITAYNTAFIINSPAVSSSCCTQNKKQRYGITKSGLLHDAEFSVMVESLAAVTALGPETGIRVNAVITFSKELAGAISC